MEHMMTATEVLGKRADMGGLVNGPDEKIFNRMKEETFRLHQFAVINAMLNRYCGPVA